MKILHRVILGFLVYAVLLVLVVFGLGGEYWYAGLQFIILMLGLYVIVMIPLSKNKALFEQRTRHPLKTSGADKVIMGFVGLFYLSWFFLMPLEHRFFGWEWGFWVTVVGVVLFFLSAGLLSAVFHENAFLMSVVSKQKKQKVVDTGLYSLVRHPMYTGAILLFFSGGAVMMSYFGLLMALCIAVTLYVRTFYEERVLLKELDGYKEYKGRVRWRLVPYVL